jgi:hypothetical protein
MCGQRPDCKDRHCPGRRKAIEALQPPEPASPSTSNTPAPDPPTWDLWLFGAIGGAVGLYCAERVARFFLLY